MAQTVLFLGMTHTSQKRTTSQYPWHKQNPTTQNLHLYQESAQLLDTCLKEKRLLALEITFYRYQDRDRELRWFFMFQNQSSLVYCNNISGVIKSMGLSMMLRKEIFLLNDPAEVSKQFIYTKGIVFHLSLLGIQYKWKKPTTVWIIWCLLLTTRGKNGWSVKILRWLN